MLYLHNNTSHFKDLTVSTYHFISFLIRWADVIDFRVLLFGPNKRVENLSQIDYTHVIDLNGGAQLIINVYN